MALTTSAMNPPPTPDQPRLFRLQRDTDHTGISGTGHIADGVLWPSGQVTICWRGEHSSIVIWPALANVLAIHSHDGATRVEWTD